MKLGFGESIRPVRLCVRNTSHSLWHIWNGKDKREEPVIQTRLACIIKGIEKQFYQSDKYGETVKLNVYVKADKNYVIQSGYTSWFSKSLLLAMVELTPEQIKNYVSIEVRSGGTDNIVFASLYDYDDRLIKSKHIWKKDKQGNAIDDIEWDEILLKLTEKFNNIPEKDTVVPEVLNSLDKEAVDKTFDRNYWDSSPVL